MGTSAGEEEMIVAFICGLAGLIFLYMAFECYREKISLLETRLDDQVSQTESWKRQSFAYYDEMIKWKPVRGEGGKFTKRGK